MTNTAESLIKLVPALTAPTRLDEFAYHGSWQAHIQPEWSPERIAFAGGVLADSLSFLFIAGYQSAVRRTFGVSGRRWSALAVSEDRSATNARPGLIESRGRLNGYKTWVASCALIDELIVSATSHASVAYYRIDRKHPGLELTVREQPGFLGDMSQGTAAFIDVDATSLERLQSLDLKQFARREPLYLYLAFCGFLSKRGRDTRVLLDQLLAIARGDFSDSRDKAAFADADDEIQQLFSELGPLDFRGRYDRDRRIMSLYSPVIQKRAGRG